MILNEIPTFIHQWSLSLSLLVWILLLLLLFWRSLSLFAYFVKENWTTLVEEDENDVLKWATCVKQNFLVLCYLHDVKVGYLCFEHCTRSWSFLREECGPILSKENSEKKREKPAWNFISADLVQKLRLALQSKYTVC